MTQTVFNTHYHLFTQDTRQGLSVQMLPFVLSLHCHNTIIFVVLGLLFADICTQQRFITANRTIDGLSMNTMDDDDLVSSLSAPRWFAR